MAQKEQKQEGMPCTSTALSDMEVKMVLICAQRYTSLLNPFMNSI